MSCIIEDTDIPDYGNRHERNRSILAQLKVETAIRISRQLVSLTREHLRLEKTEFETSSRNHTITVMMKDT